jgi:hypothetical protein
MPPSVDWLIALVNVALGVTLVEVLWLMRVLRRAPHRAHGRPGWATKPLLATLMAGLGLMVALRLAVGGAGWPWVALALAAAGWAHVIDLRARWHAAPSL